MYSLGKESIFCTQNKSKELEQSGNNMDADLNDIRDLVSGSEKITNFDLKAMFLIK